MTAPSSSHYDDDNLSGALDGEAVDGLDAHLGACGACRDRSARLDDARRALGAQPPFPEGRLDGWLAAAREAPADTAPITAAPRRRLHTPPAVWLVSAAAAIVLLAGIGGLVQANRPGAGGADFAAVTKSSADRVLPYTDEFAEGGASNSATGSTLALEDLGDQATTPDLVATLRSRDTGAARSVAGATAGAGGGSSNEAADNAAAPPAAASSVVAVQCQAEAERIGAGRFGILEYAATLRFAGQPAEVLVFSLRAPAEGVSRQALVLARPGCGLLVDPRF